MATITKIQRYSVYCVMLAEAKNLSNYSTSYGLCYLYKMLFGDLDMYKNFGGPDNFPEIWRREPAGSGMYFFPTNKRGWKKRIKLLEECIKETEPKKKTSND